MLAARGERGGGERVDVEQTRHQRRVGEIRQHRAVTGEQELARVVATEPPGVHLAFEERGTPFEPRAQDHRELVAQDRSALQRLPAHEPHEVRALLEEPERGAHDPLDLGPALADALGRLVDEPEPVGEGLEQHRSVERFLRREVVEQARPSDPDLLGDLRQARAGVPMVGETMTSDIKDLFLGGLDFRSRR